MRRGFKSFGYRGAKPDAEADSLLVHPDVRRMLLTQRAYVDGCRAFAFFAGMQLDEAKHNGDERAERFGQLLTCGESVFDG